MTDDRSILRVVGAAWFRDGRLLGARRGPGRRNAGLWELPGGKVEAGESDEVALRRELAEELGVSARIGAPIGESVHAYAHATVHLVVYTCTSTDEPVSNEHDRLAWFDAGALRAVAWSDADVPIIETILHQFQRLADETDVR